MNGCSQLSQGKDSGGRNRVKGGSICELWIVMDSSWPDQTKYSHLLGGAPAVGEVGS